MTPANSASKLYRHWIYFAIASIVTLTVYAFYGTNIIRWRNSPDYGWRAMYDSGPNLVSEVFPTGEAAGLRVGDTIDAINGKPYFTFEELFFKIRKQEPGSDNIYRITRDGKTLEISITTGLIGFKTVMRRSGPLFFISFVYVMIGALVFLMKPRAKESWVFVVMTSIFGMSVCYTSPSDLLQPLWLFDIRLLLDCLLPAPMIHLAFRFPRTRTFLRKKPGMWTAPYLFSFVLFILLEMTSTAYWNTPLILDLINQVYLLVGVLIFVVSMVWNFLKDTSVMIRLQSKAIFLGLFLGFFIPTVDLILRSFLQVYLFPDPVIGFGVFLSLFPLSIGYTIVKHDLFAIDAIIKRTYGYVMTTGAIAGSYGIVVLLSNLAFGEFKFAKSPLFPLIFILAVVFLFNPVRSRVQKFIDRVFYRLEYDYQETVQKISETMRTLLGLDKIGKSIMNFALGTMFIDAGSVLLLNRENKEYECLIRAGEKDRQSKAEVEAIISDENAKNEGPIPAAIGELKQETLKLRLPADEPLLKTIAEQKKQVTIYDIQKNPLFEAERASCEKAFDQLGATLVVPLIYEDQLTGLISLGQKKSGKFYRREDINLLNILANQGAVAIENALMVEDVIEKERMEEELNIARDLQVSMLPTECPTVEGLDIAAYSASAREVGGDFYDFIDMGTDKTGMLIGDVTGKSVSGALVMSASRTLFRTLSEEELSVKNSMMRANQRLKEDVKSGMFVALLYAVIDSEDKILTLCSAGQTQPVHVSAKTGEAVLIETKGDTFPLGILEDAAYEETQLKLEAGDKVILYTDGIVEAMNEKEEMYGFERLLAVIKSSQSVSAESLLKSILESVKAFTGEAEQHDDLTAIVVSVTE